MAEINFLRGYTSQIGYDRTEFHELMCEFARKCIAKTYGKIEYQLWRTLNAWPTDMNVEWDKDVVTLTDKDQVEIAFFNDNDGSLGRFLFDIKKREIEKAMNTSSAISAISNASVSALDSYNTSVDGLVSKADSSTTYFNCNDYYSDNWNTYNGTADKISNYDGVSTWTTITDYGSQISDLERKVKEVMKDLENLKVNKADAWQIEDAKAYSDNKDSIMRDDLILKAEKTEINEIKENLDSKVNVADFWYVHDELDRRLRDVINETNRLTSQLYTTEANSHKNMTDCDNLTYQMSEVLKYIETLKHLIEEKEDKNIIFNKTNNTINFVNKTTNINKTNKEKEKMKNLVNFDFGPCTGDNVRLSMYGLAVKNVSGTWVSYDAANHAIMDVDVFNFEGGKFLYKMPVAIKDIKVGDVVIHSRKPMFVTRVAEKSLWAVDPVEGENKEIMLTVSPFGFNFATKVVNFMDGMTGAAPSNDCPFGNMWMLMMMEDGGNMSDMLPLMMMGNGAMGSMNPMMMYFLMKGDGDGSMSDMLPWLFMMNGMGATSSAAPTT